MRTRPVKAPAAGTMRSRATVWCGGGIVPCGSCRACTVRIQPLGSPWASSKLSYVHVPSVLATVVVLVLAGDADVRAGWVRWVGIPGGCWEGYYPCIGIARAQPVPVQGPTVSPRHSRPFLGLPHTWAPAPVGTSTQANRGEIQGNIS